MNELDKFCEAKSDQLNNVDLIGNNRIITITKVKFTNSESQGCVISYEGDNGRPWKPCKTTARIMKEKWGGDYQKWVGRSVELFRDPDVVYAGKKEGGIRIFGLSDIPSDFETVIRLSRNNVKTIKVKKLANNTADAALKASGDEASKLGVEPYTAWLATLTPEQKASIKHLHSDWTKIAKSVVTKEEGTI